VLTKKKKITKKVIKEDKLVTTYYKTLEFIDKYKRQIYIYGGIILVVVIAAYWYINERTKNNEMASSELAKVMEYYAKGSYQEAIEGVPASNIVGLKKIVEDYGSTENGESAKIFLADSYASLGKMEEAYKYYDDYSGSNKMFKATALAGKASYFEYKNEYLKAADAFNEAGRVSQTNPENAGYLLNASIDYIKAGEKVKAKGLLEKIRDDYNTSMAARNVDRYLALVDEQD
jgi:tetratricopeptide (TPR) repeat protein